MEENMLDIEISLYNASSHVQMHYSILNFLSVHNELYVNNYEITPLTIFKLFS